VTHHARTLYTDDWYIVRKELAGISAVVGVSLESYRFKSPSLHYGAKFYLAKASIGASIGVNVTALSSALLSAVSSQANVAIGNINSLRGGNNKWRILRRFSLNNLVGGSIRIGTVGAAIGPIDGNGATLKIYDNTGLNVASYQGGSFGAGVASVQINIGTAAIGVLVGPYYER